MNSLRKLTAVVACRSSGSRLYGKPMQRLSIESGWTVLDQVIYNLKKLAFVDDIVLAISEGDDNLCYRNFATNNGIKFVFGDEIDVLQRLIKGLKFSSATDLFRVTSESPFLFSDTSQIAWEEHCSQDADATFQDDIIDGCGFEIISVEALIKSWQLGDSLYRSELCSLYIRHNRDSFNVIQIPAPELLCRRDLRLTVDYPEDLIVCRNVYANCKISEFNSSIDLQKAVKFLDDNPLLRDLVKPFTVDGYSLMYH